MLGIVLAADDFYKDLTCTYGGKAGVQTAVGCIPYGDPTAMASYLVTWAFGIGGGVAFLLIVFAGYQIITSAGDPKKTQGGKELLGAAIGGIVVIIFSAFLLRFLGVSVLGIF